MAGGGETGQYFVTKTSPGWLLTGVLGACHKARGVDSRAGDEDEGETFCEGDEPGSIAFRKVMRFVSVVATYFQKKKENGRRPSRA